MSQELYKLRKNIVDFFNNEVLSYSFSKVLEFGPMTLDSCPIKELFVDTRKILQNKGVEYDSCDPFTNTEHNSFVGDMTIWNDEFEKRKNSYDAILAFDCLEHTEQFWNIPEIFYNLLKPNGKIFVSVPFYLFIHPGESYKDNWRFTDTGLQILFSKYFDCTIKFLDNNCSTPIHITLIGERKNG